MGLIEAVKIVLIPTDSDAVFHEESEYGVGFKIRAKKVGLSSIFRKQFIFLLLKKLKVHFLYFAYIFAKKRFILKKFITKIISENFSTNPESFNKFGRGRRIDLANSDGMTLYHFIMVFQNLHVTPVDRS